MNEPNALKSPRTSTIISSTLESLESLAAAQRELLEKEQQISTLKGQINRLELKNKEYSSYQLAMVEYEERMEESEAQVLKTNEKLRLKGQECEQLKEKLEKELREKKEKNTSYVKHSEYMKISNEFKDFKEKHRTCDQGIKILERNIESAKEESNQSIADLHKEIYALNQTISKKDVEINSLKVEKYSKSKLTIDSNRDMTTSIINMSNSRMLSPTHGHNVVSSFRVIGDDVGSNVSIGESMNHELAYFSRENDELKSRINKLEQELLNYHSLSETKTKENKGQYGQIIEEYENRLANMATKVSSLHKLELEKSSMEQEVRKLKVEKEELKSELSIKTINCENLEKKIREYERYKSMNMQSDVGTFISKNDHLAKQTDKLEQILKEKYEKVLELQNSFKTLNITQQTFISMNENLNSLEKRLTETKQELSKEHNRVLEEEEKYFKLQKENKKMEISLNEAKSEMAKTNRMVSQKVQKIEFQNLEIKRLEKENLEKKELSEKLAKQEINYRKLEKQLEQELDLTNELSMSVLILSAEVERKNMIGNVTQDFVTQFEILKKKSKETEECSNKLEERVRRLEQLHKQVIGESIKISEHLHASHKKWNHYDSAMEGLVKFLEETNNKNQLKYEETNAEIDVWLSQQDKRLAELNKISF